MNEEQLEEFLEEINDDIVYIMDGYYGGMDAAIIDKLRAKFKPLLRHDSEPR